MVSERKSSSRRQPAVAVLLLVAVGVLSLASTRGLNFLSTISIIFIGVQAVTAINFHLLASKSPSGSTVKSNEPFRFRTPEETVISVAFALAGIATLTGVLHADKLAGWLALGAAAAGAANIVATRRSAAASSRNSSVPGMAVACGVLAMLADGPAASASSAASTRPQLAFTAMTALKSSGFSVRNAGADEGRPVTLVRGSKRGVVPKPFSAASWSADGTRIAFRGSQGPKTGIYTVRADGTGLRFLRGTKDGSHPVFSPDGSRLAFARLQFGRNWRFGTTAWVADADGSGARRLTGLHDGIDYLPSAFSPDGSALAVTRIGADPHKPTALLFGLHGSGSVRQLARRASEPAFSPDGSQIALVRHSFSRRLKVKISHRDLIIMSADGKTAKPLTRTRYIAESRPNWDPSGQRIAFNALRISRDPIEALFDQLLPFGNSIVQINADGTCRQRVLRLKGTALFGATWQPGSGRDAGRIEC